MKTQVRWWVLSAAVVGASCLVGCGQKQSASSAPPAASQQSTAQPAGESAEEYGESGENIASANTTKEIWGQVLAEKDKLSAAIQNGQLKDIHHLAFGIRDLVVALAEKTTGLSSNDATALSELVDQVKDSARKLDELGDAGNLSGTQAEFERLNKVLDSIKTLTGSR